MLVIFYQGGMKMIDIKEWVWVVNTKDMTCRNVENDVTIKMEKIGESLRGTLHDMPMQLFAEISKYSDGEKTIEKIVKTAEEEFFMVSDQA
jgi:hypothetical protein